MEIKPIRQAQTADQSAVVACVRAAYAKYLVRMSREPAPMNADYEALIIIRRTILKQKKGLCITCII